MRLEVTSPDGSDRYLLAEDQAYLDIPVPPRTGQTLDLELPMWSGQLGVWQGFKNANVTWPLHARITFPEEP